MKYRDITGKTDAELQTMLAEERTKLAEAYVDMRTKQVANVKHIGAVKTTIARILTAQKHRELTQLEESNG